MIIFFIDKPVHAPASARLFSRRKSRQNAVRSILAPLSLLHSGFFTKCDSCCPGTTLKKSVPHYEVAPQNAAESETLI